MIDFPEVLIESIRKLYPMRKNKGKEQERIREALERIMGGEIDGNPRTSNEAITYLRDRIADASEMLRMREKRFIPHLTTWLNQSRYIPQRDAHKPLPANLDDAVTILQQYPGIVVTSKWGMKEIDAHMPILRVISGQLSDLKAANGGNPVEYLLDRVLRFAACVAMWPENELQFLPGAMKFFRERRFEQDSRRWERTASNGFASERDQLRRVV